MQASGFRAWISISTRDPPVFLLSLARKMLAFVLKSWCCILSASPPTLFMCTLFSKEQLWDPWCLSIQFSSLAFDSRSLMTAQTLTMTLPKQNEVPAGPFLKIHVSILFLLAKHCSASWHFHPSTAIASQVARSSIEEILSCFFEVSKKWLTFPVFPSLLPPPQQCLFCTHSKCVL